MNPGSGRQQRADGVCREREGLRHPWKPVLWYKGAEVRRTVHRIMLWIAVTGAALAPAVPVAGFNGRTPGSGQPATRASSASSSSTTQREPREILITFEDADGPCRFPETSALRDRYTQLGVTFSGPEDVGGGAILGDCSKFGVEGYGGYRFLAFNAAARLAGGGVPKGPEVLSFSWPVQNVEVLAGSPAQGSVSLICLDGDGAPAGWATIELAKALQPLSVSSRNIASCQIDFDAGALVLDNLRFTPQQALPIPAQTLPGMGLLILLLAASGVALLGRL